MIDFRKETEKEIRRFKEYKERAAKRFHQITKTVERNDRDIVDIYSGLTKVKSRVDDLTDNVSNLVRTSKNVSNELKTSAKSQNLLREYVDDIFSTLNQSVENLTSCCDLNLKLANQTLEYSIANQNSGILTNQVTGSNHMTSNHIEIVEFGSGEGNDEILSKLEEESNAINNKYPLKETLYYGSGETTLEGSGDNGSGEEEQLPPLVRINLDNYVEKSDFEEENKQLRVMLNHYVSKSDTMTKTVQELEEKVASIKLGSFVQILQDSLMNFTQNVITLDQWKVSSNQIVNTTLYNHDQIIKLTNMVIENQGQGHDLMWKVNNHEMLVDQQYNILRMYIIRLNNSLEDMREHIKKLENGQTRTVNNNNFQYHSGFYGNLNSNQYRDNVQFESKDDQDYENQSSDEANRNNGGPSLHPDIVKTLMSRLDQLGLQIVFNQNRIANMEVKVYSQMSFLLFYVF